MTWIQIFAYGSNLNEDQMRARCPSATLRGPARLPGHALVFRGFSRRWQGAVASVVLAPGSEVWGLVYRVSPEDVVRLDRFEGCPVVYRRAKKLVVPDASTRTLAEVYLQRRGDDPSRGPSPRYFNRIWRAYECFGFDPRPLFRAVRSFQQ